RRPRRRVEAGPASQLPVGGADQLGLLAFPPVQVEIVEAAPLAELLEGGPVLALVSAAEIAPAGDQAGADVAARGSLLTNLDRVQGKAKGTSADG
ncbi:MAG: hypothetical protein ACRDYB_13650, partial [Acidimicrobiales bacterium]